MLRVRVPSISSFYFFGPLIRLFLDYLFTNFPLPWPLLTLLLQQLLQTKRKKVDRGWTKSKKAFFRYPLNFPYCSLCFCPLLSSFVSGYPLLLSFALPYVSYIACKNWGKRKIILEKISLDWKTIKQRKKKGRKNYELNYPSFFSNGKA